ncbi:MAG TPA: glycogen synthase GlgA [Planctomycetota bacterium]|nr:glycogen synthase GlgA [Planctomycetota bacterium]
MRILLAASEAAPFAKTGGLADVAGALPGALAALGHEACLFMPYYRQVAAAGVPVRMAARLHVPLGAGRAEAAILRGAMPGSGAPVYFVARDEFYNRPGLYNAGGQDYIDNCERFAFFCRAVCEAVRELELAPDVIHCHDWQTALVPAYLRFLYRDAPRLAGAASVFTIHNLAYQGQFPPWKMPATGLDVSHFNWKEYEFYGNLNLMKGALIHADVLNTVSKRYAREIQTPENGYGLNGVLAERHADLFGIVNGLDYSVWDPAGDGALAARYSPARPAGKARCKRAAQEELGLAVDPDRPLLVIVTRLTEQKGLDILGEALPGIMAMPVQFALLGDGEERYKWAFSELAGRFPGRMAVRFGLDERLAHRLTAAADIYLMPSRFEPCGLSQLIALRYGAVPVVRETGGLADTITDSVNGFTFFEYNGTALLVAVRRALAAMASPAFWRKLVRECMSEDWGWRRSAGEYARLYALARSRRGLPVPIAPEHAPAEEPASPARRKAVRKKSDRKPASRRRK